MTCASWYGASNPNVPASPNWLKTAVTKSTGTSLCLVALEHLKRSQAFQLGHEGCKLNLLSKWKRRVFFPPQLHGFKSLSSKICNKWLYYESHSMSVGSAKYVIADWCKQKSAGLHLLNWSRGYFYMKLGIYRYSCTNILHRCTDFTWKVFGGYCNALGDAVLTQTTPACVQRYFGRVAGNNRREWWRGIHAFSFPFVTVKKS